MLSEGKHVHGRRQTTGGPETIRGKSIAVAIVVVCVLGRVDGKSYHAPMSIDGKNHYAPSSLSIGPQTYT